jgi:hypothetical protein
MGDQSQGRWRQLIRTFRAVERDWVFYSFAFIPFFIISFAVWICLDEAIFALRYRIVIQWSLFPYIRIFPDTWHYLGLILFIFGMILMGMTLLMQRGSTSDSLEKQDSIRWFQIFSRFRGWLSQTPALVIIGLFGLTFLGVAVSCMYYAFFSQLHCLAIGPDIPCFTNLFGVIIVESLYLHQLGDVLVALGLALLFLVVIRERSND